MGDGTPGPRGAWAPPREGAPKREVGLREEPLGLSGGQAPEGSHGHWSMLQNDPLGNVVATHSYKFYSRDEDF